MSYLELQKEERDRISGYISEMVVWRRSRKSAFLKIMRTYVYIWAKDYHSDPIELNLGIPENAIKAVKFASENGFGVYACHKEINIPKFSLWSGNAQTLWRAISLDREITPKLMQQIYPTN